MSTILLLSHHIFSTLLTLKIKSVYDCLPLQNTTIISLSFTIEGMKCVAKPHATISAPSKRVPVSPKYSPA